MWVSIYQVLCCGVRTDVCGLTVAAGSLCVRGEQHTHKEEEVKSIHPRIRESFTPYRKVSVSEAETKVKQTHVLMTLIWSVMWHLTEYNGQRKLFMTEKMHRVFRYICINNCIHAVSLWSMKVFTNNHFCPTLFLSFFVETYETLPSETII